MIIDLGVGVVETSAVIYPAFLALAFVVGAMCGVKWAWDL